jgi:hypothetical protein
MALNGTRQWRVKPHVAYRKVDVAAEFEANDKPRIWVHTVYYWNRDCPKECSVMYSKENTPLLHYINQLVNGV